MRVALQSDQLPSRGRVPKLYRPLPTPGSRGQGRPVGSEGNGMDHKSVPPQGQAGAVAEAPEVIPLKATQVLRTGLRTLPIQQSEHALDVRFLPGLLRQVQVCHIPILASSALALQCPV